MRSQVLALAAFAAGSFAVPTAYNSTANATEPCGIITQLLKNYYSDPSNAGSLYGFLPSLAQACLLSSSIDNELAAAYVTELSKYVEFQSTLAYLKNPPSGYFYPPVDILGGLEMIKSKAAAGGYKSQYEFDLALNQLIFSAHDGHLGLQTCTSQAISYQRGTSSQGLLQLVSVSSDAQDGTKLPVLYNFDDLVASQYYNQTASPIVRINGQSISASVADVALIVNSDPDAAYNSLLWNYGAAPARGGFNGIYTGTNSYVYPGDWSNVTFANGTTYHFKNIAITSAELWSPDIVDGKSFTEYFCIAPAQPSPTNSTASPTSSATPATGTTAPTLLGYPYYPVVKDPNNQIAGYFLNSTGYQDTAVLRIPSFLNETGPAMEVPVTFQNSTRDFFAAAKAANKTKLIIDVSGNGGGNTILPNDVFNRLFPSIEPYGGGRLRISTAGNVYGSTFESIPDSVLAIMTSDNATIQRTKAALFAAPWDYRSALTTGLNNFTGWTAGATPLFPPVTNNGDNFTALTIPPLNNTFYDVTSDVIVPVGYAGQTELPQPFETQNVVLLTDGVCASACSILAEFLTRQAGVKTIVVGGRPQNAPMQAIGGVKGTLAYPFTNLAALSGLFASYPLSAYIPASLRAAAKASLPGLVSLPLGAPAALSNYGVNLRDNIQPGGGGVPLQFVFEAADCRIWYDQRTVVNPLRLWEMVHDIAWKGAKCAYGSMTGNGTTGNGTSGGGSGGGSGSGSGSGNGTLPGQSANAGVKSMGMSVWGIVAGAMMVGGFLV